MSFFPFFYAFSSLFFDFWAKIDSNPAMSSAIHGVAPGNLAGLPLPGLAGKRAMVSMLSSALFFFLHACGCSDVANVACSEQYSYSCMIVLMQDGVQSTALFDTR
jgi:hypothetical protein